MSGSMKSAGADPPGPGGRHTFKFTETHPCPAPTQANRHRLRREATHHRHGTFPHSIQSPPPPPLSSHPRRPFPLQTLKGATIFASDLVRAIHPVPDGLEMGFVRASSYGHGTKSTGTVVLGISTLKEEDVKDRHLLLVSIV
jgi:hypothetical protein